MCNLSTPVNTLLSLPLTQTCCWILELSPKFAHHQSSVSTKRICDPQFCSSTLSHKLKFTPKLIWRLKHIPHHYNTFTRHPFCLSLETIVSSWNQHPI
jgi:hypothetical protein